jgi:hypothetical protein
MEQCGGGGAVGGPVFGRSHQLFELIGNPLIPGKAFFVAHRCLREVVVNSEFRIPNSEF